jgi:hypothetical protein
MEGGMESRSWYEQERELKRIGSSEESKPEHLRITAADFSGNRAERRQQAAEAKRAAKKAAKQAAKA